MEFIVDKAKALKKWSPVLEHLNIDSVEKKEWMAEYAEMHQMNENVAYSTLGNLNGMGAVTAPQVGGVPGATFNYNADGSPNSAAGSSQGSGDVAQNLLPISMKIAAHTIGLDLVAVKPASSPRLELLFVDFKYDNNPEAHGSDFGDEKPLVFKLNYGDDKAAVKTLIDLHIAKINATNLIGGLDKRAWFVIGVAAPGAVPVDAPDATSRENVLEFLGYSRVDGHPMFRSYRQDNNTASYTPFASGRNTFPDTDTSALDYINASGLTMLSGDTTGNTDTAEATIELISTMEDHLPGFSAGWNLNTPMSRLDDENSYPGVIAPDLFTKAIQVGDVEISSSLKRTQIEDIKASTGMDVVQKLESVLVNELTQTISKEIVAKIRTLAEENANSNTAPVSFDFDVDAYTAINGPAPGGETYHSIQRKLVTKINTASNYIYTEGRIGPAQYLITNGRLASVLQDVAGYITNPVVGAKMNSSGQLHPMGTIGNIAIYVDPYMSWSDDRIFLGRKNSVDQPGLVFVPYLMAQSISLISEATWAPRMLIRSRYAIADIGFFPWKQFMQIKVTDTNGVLS